MSFTVLQSLALDLLREIVFAPPPINICSEERNLLKFPIKFNFGIISDLKSQEKHKEFSKTLYPDSPGVNMLPHPPSLCLSL